MADALKTVSDEQTAQTTVSEKDISINEVKSFDTADNESITAFLDSIKGAILDSGHLNPQREIVFPKENGSGSQSLRPASEEKLSNLPPADQRSNELYFSDVVQLLNDAAYWLLTQKNNEAVLAEIDQGFRQIAESKHGFLSQWGAVVNNGQNVSESALEKHRHELIWLVNYIDHLAELYFENQEEEGSDKDEEEVDQEAAEPADKPKDAPSTAGATQKTDPQDEVGETQTTSSNNQRSAADLEQNEKIQYEATWIYNRALHELFISHGISYEYLASHPGLRDFILAETMEYLENRSKKELELLFANPRRRLEILDELYIRLSRSPEFISKLNAFYAGYAQNLPEEERQEFVESFGETIAFFEQGAKIKTVSEDHLLREELTEILGTDSPTLVGVGTPEFTRVIGSIQTAVDAMILNHGVDLEVITTVNGKPSLNTVASSAHNAIWLIKNMSDEHLKLMLGIPDNISLTPEAIEKIRKLLIRYARMRVVQLAEESENLKTSLGISSLTEEEAAAIANNDTETIHRRLLPAHQTTAESIKEHGTETVARAVSTDVKKEANRKVRQWNQLSTTEKKIIAYEYLGYTEETYTDFETIPEKIELFNLQALALEAQMIAETQAQLHRQALAEQILQYESLMAYAAEQEQAIYAEALRQAYVHNYLLETSPEVQQYLTNSFNVDDPRLLNNYSLMDLQNAESKGMLSGKIKGLAGKLPSPKEKALNALKKAGGDKLKKMVGKKLLTRAALASGTVAAGAALLADERTRKWVLGGLGAAGAYIVNGLIQAMQSAAAFGGAVVGGAIGGVAGFFIAGPAGAVVLGTVGAGVGGNIGGSVLGGGGISEATGGLFSGGGSGSAATTSTAATDSLGSLSRPITKPTTAGTAPSYTQTTPTAPSGATELSTAATSGQGAGAAAATTAAAGSTGAGAAISGLSVAMLASIGSMMLVAIVSVIVLLIIQGAFLITLPPSVGTRGYESYLGGFEGCWPTTGTITVYRTYSDGRSHSTISAYEGYTGPGIALDIGTRANTQAQGGQNPPIYTPFAGTAKFFPDGTGVPGEDGSYPYGNYVVVDTGNFLLIFAHMLQFPSGISMSSTTENIQLQAGEFIGTVDSTGNSTGHHLHYEIVGGDLDIIDIVPLSDNLREEARENEDAILGLRVDSGECSRTNIDREQNVQGYIAIGPRDPQNLVVSETSVAQSPIHPCDWYGQNSGLDVATNANFYNTSTQPVGAGGSNPATYFSNPENVADPEEFTQERLRYLGIGNVGSSVQIGPIPLNWFNQYEQSETAFPLNQFSKIVTGVISDIPNDGREVNRIAIGTGNVSGQCTEYSGDAFIIGAMRDATYDDMRDLMTQCGADEFIFLDGGDSASFCSEEYLIQGARIMPVHVGLNQADVTSITEENEEEEESQPTPPPDDDQPVPI